MTRQYVGARYVPKFSSPLEWSDDRPYEALEIVTHLGSSYTSKIPVPVGVDITNETYWVCTGNYNSQVEQYRQEVETLKNSVANMDYLDGKKILIFGDSISAAGATAHWTDYLEEKVPSTCTVDNSHSEGGRFITGAQGVADIMNGLSSLEMACDILIVFAGVNDFRHSRNITNGTDNDYSTLIGALKMIRSNIQSKCPTANVFFVSPLRNYETEYPDAHKADMPLILYRNVIYDFCAQTGFTFIDGFSAPMLNPAFATMKQLYQPDGLHPNAAYAPLLCEYIYNKILENSPVPPAKEIVLIDGADYCQEGVTNTYTNLYLDESGKCHLIAAVTTTLTANVSKTLFLIPQFLTPAYACVGVADVLISANDYPGILKVSSTVSDGKSAITVKCTEGGNATIGIDFVISPKAMNYVFSASL